MKTIIYDSIENEFKPLKFNDSFITSTHYCPICNKEFIIGDDSILVLNDGKLFPNILIHKDCFSEDKPENTIYVIKENYEQAKIKLEEIRSWFDYNRLTKIIEGLEKEIYWKKKAEEGEWT